MQDLKKELKLRGLSITGNKNELVERLQNSLSKSDAINSECVDDLEEDLLNVSTTYVFKSIYHYNFRMMMTNIWMQVNQLYLKMI